MTEVAVKLGTGGRLLIPGDFREAMGLAPGRDLALELIQQRPEEADAP